MFRLTAMLCLLTSPALADLVVCNDLNTPADVAIGYSDQGTWTSEGWWQVAPNDCATIYSGDIPHRYYYWRGMTENGVLPTEDYSFCVASNAFTIRGDENCDARGYERASFTEVDTGQATDYVIMLETENAKEEPAQDYQADANKLYNALQGRWSDATDPDFQMIVENDIIIDIYGRNETSQAIWNIAETCTGANGAGPVMVVQYVDLGDTKLCWVLLELNAQRLKFRAVGATKDVVMLRKQ